MLRVGSSFIRNLIASLDKGLQGCSCAVLRKLKLDLPCREYILKHCGGKHLLANLAVQRNNDLVQLCIGSGLEENLSCRPQEGGVGGPSSGLSVLVSGSRLAKAAFFVLGANFICSLNNRLVLSAMGSLAQTRHL